MAWCSSGKRYRNEARAGPIAQARARHQAFGFLGDPHCPRDWTLGHGQCERSEAGGKMRRFYRRPMRSGIALRSCSGTMRASRPSGNLRQRGPTALLRAVPTGLRLQRKDLPKRLPSNQKQGGKEARRKVLKCLPRGQRIGYGERMPNGSWVRFSTSSWRKISPVRRPAGIANCGACRIRGPAAFSLREISSI